MNHEIHETHEKKKANENPFVFFVPFVVNSSSPKTHKKVLMQQLFPNPEALARKDCCRRRRRKTRKITQ
jgi:hypothetical protein